MFNHIAEKARAPGRVDDDVQMKYQIGNAKELHTPGNNSFLF